MKMFMMLMSACTAGMVLTTAASYFNKPLF